MASVEQNGDNHTHTLPPDTVLIAGGGPVGLLLARVLSFYGTRSILFERNKTTTSWPKMDLTNARSMELFQKIGLAEDLRRQGVPPDIDQDVLISSGLSQARPLTMWELPGVDKFRNIIQNINDGSQPREPWQRLSQAIFERWLREICDKDPLITLKYGYRVDRVEEYEDHVKTTIIDVDTSTSRTYISSYVAGCDGASSKVRRSLELPLDGGPIPACALLVHFKSRDLARLRKQGRFWHIFFLQPHGGFGAAIISQDEIDTFTVHLFLPLDVDTDKIESKAAIYRALGGLYDDFHIDVDDILVRSVWRPNIAVTRSWHSPNYRCFLAGDSAHQNIPTGGYGMNMGIGDAFDLGWKLAAVINGQGGPGLLASYEQERRPVALRNVDHSGVHFKVHQDLEGILKGHDPKQVDADSPEGAELRKQIHEHYQRHDGENKDFGIEMGYRYNSSIILREADESEPLFDAHRFVPTSWPGGRAPSLILSNGEALYDTFGKHWTLLNFSTSDVGALHLLGMAQKLNVELRLVELSTEQLAKAIYEKPLILIRPDQHVAWRGESLTSPEAAAQILNSVTGQSSALSIGINGDSSSKPVLAFTSSGKMHTQVNGFELEQIGEFQR